MFDRGNTPGIALVFGVLLTFEGGYLLITGDPTRAYGYFPIPPAAGWIFLPLGILVCALSLLSWKRGEGKEVYTREDRQNSKEYLDAEYERLRLEKPEEYDTEEIRRAKAAFDKLLEDDEPEQDRSPKN